MYREENGEAAMTTSSARVIRLRVQILRNCPCFSFFSRSISNHSGVIVPPHGISTESDFNDSTHYAASSTNSKHLKMQSVPTRGHALISMILLYQTAQLGAMPDDAQASSKGGSRTSVGHRQPTWLQGLVFLQVPGAEGTFIMLRRQPQAPPSSESGPLPL